MGIHWWQAFNHPQEHTDSLGPPPSGLPTNKKSDKKSNKKNTAPNSNIKPSGTSSAAALRMAEGKYTGGVNTDLGNDTGAPTGGGIDGVDPNTMAALMSIFGSSGGGSGGGSSSSNALAKARMSIAANQLAWEKQKYLNDADIASRKLGNERSGLDQYIANIQSQIDAGPSIYGKAQEDLIGQLGGIYDTAKSTIGSSQSDLEKSLAGITNPFAGYQAQVAPTFDTTNLQNLLAGSQVGTDPLQRMAALQQNENTAQTAGYQNLINTLGSLFQGGINDRLANAKQSGVFANSQADLNKAALTSQLRGQQTSELEKLRQALMQAQLNRGQLG
jgi:hypothetical protein